MKTPGFVFPSLLLAAHLVYAAALFAVTEPFPVVSLADGWALQSSRKVADMGDVISKSSYAPKGWYTVTVPITVVAALVKQKVYPDPAFGMNLRQFPGMTYPIGANFSNSPMQQDSPFAVAWWYRKSFTLPAGSYSITAGYQGDANDTGSTSAALSLTVIQATTAVKLVSSAPSVVVTNSVTFTSTVTGNGGTPTGNVTFMDGTNTLGSVAVSGSGVAAYTTSSLTVGTHNITAVYGGDANDSGSTSAALVETVTAYGTQTSLAASSTSLNTDQELTLLTTTTTTGGGAVTGTITYMNGTTTLGSATVGTNGTATLSINPAAGSYSITAHYSGDALNAPSVSNAVTVTVSQATEFTIALNPTTLSIPTTQSAGLTINLGSQDGFTDKIALGCGSLPYSVTCNFSSNDITLNSNGQASVQLTVDTNSPLASGSRACLSA